MTQAVGCSGATAAWRGRSSVRDGAWWCTVEEASGVQAWGWGADPNGEKDGEVGRTVVT